MGGKIDGVIPSLCTVEVLMLDKVFLRVTTQASVGLDFPNVAFANAFTNNWNTMELLAVNFPRVKFSKWNQCRNFPVAEFLLSKRD